MENRVGLFLLLTTVTGIQTDRQIFTVTTNIGIINGFTENVTFLEKTSKVHMFLGIPYAEPPVGNLRFEKPVPKTPLASPLDAFTHNNACVQGYQWPNITYSEDCLYLNIYAPERDDPNVKLPVMVWIYGGGFHYGESNSYFGDHLSCVGDVIVVTFNYRVSIFGFFSTGDAASSGNYGLWDQHLAIKWVHDNIAEFGGDTDNVTLFGESAGAASVIYQGLYSENNGLFQRMIAQSGTVTTWWGSTDKGPNVAKVVGSLANCSTVSSISIVTCLRNLPAQRLIDIVSFPTGADLPEFSFLPAMDGEFIKYDPKHVFDIGSRESEDAVQFFSSLDFLTGVVAGEGITGLDPMFGVMDMFNFMPSRNDFQDSLVPILIKERYGEDFTHVLKKVIIAEYTNWTDPGSSSNIRNEFIRMHADYTYNSNMYKTLDTHSVATSSKKTYMYYLDIEPETKLIVDLDWYTKAVHGDDLPLIFGYRSGTQPFASPKEWESRLSQAMMTLWTNFASTGDPNSPVDIGLNWTSYRTESQQYLHITRNMTSSNVKQRWNIGAPYFWLETVPSVIKSESCNEIPPEVTNSAMPAFLYSGRSNANDCLLLFLATVVSLLIGLHN